MLYILFAVYLAAINFFALLFVRKQKKAAADVSLFSIQATRARRVSDNAVFQIPDRQHSSDDPFASVHRIERLRGGQHIPQRDLRVHLREKSKNRLANAAHSALRLEPVFFI